MPPADKPPADKPSSSTSSPKLPEVSDKPPSSPGLFWSEDEERTQISIPVFKNTPPPSALKAPPLPPKAPPSPSETVWGHRASSPPFFETLEDRSFQGTQVAASPLAAPFLKAPPKPPKNSLRWRVVLWVFLALGLIAATAATSALGNGSWVAAALPTLVFAVGILLFRLPLRTSTLCLLFLMLVCDYLPEGPQSGLWASPLMPLARLLFLNLSFSTGISALRLTGLDAAVIVLLLVGVWRRAFRIEHLDPPGTPSVRQLNFLLILQFFAVIGLDAWGVYTDGDFNESLWQLRQMLLFPVMGFFFLHAIPGRTSDFVLIARVLVAAAIVKSFIGIYFMRAIVWRNGWDVEFTTSHSDTMLFVPVLVMAVALALERPILKTLWHLPLWAPIVAMGMKYNDRRLAYVALGASLFVVMAMLPWSRIKRTVLQITLVGAPFLALYVSAGWEVDHYSRNPLWAPALMIKSLIKGDPNQAGADYRDMENFNVLYTWSENAVVPLGFGHRFEEAIVLPDISFVMPTYQFHPHNTILWMWAIGGLFGFTAMFLPAVAAIFFAARAYPLAKHPVDRTAIFTALSFIITYFMQCWGDMGTRSYFSSMGLALALTVISKLAVRTGAWPAPRKKVLS